MSPLKSKTKKTPPKRGEVIFIIIRLALFLRYFRYLENV